MKKTNLLYWILTSLFAGIMLLSGISGLFPSQAGIAGFQHLGYPVYLLPFLSLAKILGAITILIPGYPGIKEWAYAGLVIDLTGATYSMIRVHSPAGSLVAMAFLIALAAGSYIFYHRRQKFISFIYAG